MRNRFYSEVTKKITVQSEKFSTIKLNTTKRQIKNVLNMEPSSHTVTMHKVEKRRRSSTIYDRFLVIFIYIGFVF